MNAPSQDIKDLLLEKADSGEFVFGVDLHVGRVPQEPPEVITIADVTNMTPFLQYDRDEAYFYHSIQVRVRSTGYQRSWQLSYRVMELLHGLGHEVVNGSLYTVIYATGTPAFIQWDENNRCIFIINFNLQRRKE